MNRHMVTVLSVECRQTPRQDEHASSQPVYACMHACMYACMHAAVQPTCTHLVYYLMGTFSALGPDAAAILVVSAFGLAPSLRAISRKVLGGDAM